LQADDGILRRVLVDAEAIYGFRCATCDPLDHGTKGPVQVRIFGVQACVTLL
jgi:hypothetical protein